jgi:chorismate--pyruvate lyase
VSIFLETRALIWQSIVEIEVPENILSWLIDKNSLTQKLKNKYPKFNLEVLSVEDKKPANNELDVLKINNIPSIREVLLKDDETPIIFARSIIPYTKDTVDLHGLKQRPLGEILFDDKNISRYSLEVTKADNIWGRRHIFKLGETEILVSEFFLTL